ncbi:MAG: HEPN domain-containing protein [Chloroflexi bacterium]|nr:HEPN domain-containing protein [Chloroflexota bacterium]
MREAKPWFDQADYDMKTADAMLRTRRYQYVVFMAHLSLEKLLKGLVTEAIKRAPPKTHDLLDLAEIASLELPAEFGEFFRRLNVQTLEARYPTGIVQFNSELAQEVLRQAREAFVWLQGQRGQGGGSTGGPLGRSKLLMTVSEEKLPNMIGEFVVALAALGIEVQKAVLFGSYVNGWPRPASDIDLAVVSDSFKGVPRERRWELLATAKATCDHRIEPLAYTPGEYHRAGPATFLGEIKRTGKVIYEAT